MTITVTFLFANWCHHCMTFKSEWATLKSKSAEHGIKCVEYEDTDPTMPSDLRNKIQGYPTIIINIDDKEYDYNGKRTADSIIEYVNSNKGNAKEEKSANKPKLILYYADWCGYCTQFMPVWNELTTHEKMGNVDLAKYNHDSKETQSAGIKGYPTLMLYVGNNSFKYVGDRTIDNIIKFVEEKTKGESKDDTTDYYKKYMKYKYKYMNYKK